MDIQLPLQIINGKLSYSKDTKTAINSFIELLISTPSRSCLADPQFGFIFSSFKISGTSSNINTFAAELKKAIEEYEKRLSNVSVSMVYIKNQKEIQVNIEGVITETNEVYNYSTSIKIWN